MAKIKLHNDNHITVTAVYTSTIHPVGPTTHLEKQRDTQGIAYTIMKRTLNPTQWYTIFSGLQDIHDKFSRFSYRFTVHKQSERTNIIEMFKKIQVRDWFNIFILSFLKFKWVW